MSRHRHRWYVGSWGPGKQITFTCRCREQRTREMDAVEYARFKKRALGPMRVHSTWHKMPIAPGYETMTDQNEKIAKVAEIEKFAKKHPKEVVMLGCDDSYFCSSDIILATHESAESFMGTTVLMFPQCDGRPPAEFFLYPQHLDALVKALRVLQQRERKVSVIENRARAADRAWWNARKP